MDEYQVIAKTEITGNLADGLAKLEAQIEKTKQRIAELKAVQDTMNGTDQASINAHGDLQRSIDQSTSKLKDLEGAYSAVNPQARAAYEAQKDLDAAMQQASTSHVAQKKAVDDSAQAHAGLFRQLLQTNDAVTGLGRGLMSATMQIPLMTGLWVALGREVGQAFNTAKQEADELLNSLNKLASVNPKFDMSQGFSDLQNISSKTAVGIKDVADAEYLLTDAANRTQAQTAALTEEVSKGSYVFQVNDAIMAKAAEGGIQSWRLGVDQAWKVFDQASIALANGNIAADDLFQNYNRLSVSAHNLNMTMPELTAAIADNSRAGDVDSRTMTALDNLFTHMNTDKFREGLASINVSFYDAQGQAKSFTDLMEEISAKIKTMTPTEQQDFWATLAPDMRTRRGLMEFFQNFDQTYIPALQKAKDALAQTTEAESQFGATSERIYTTDKAKSDQFGASIMATLAGIGAGYVWLTARITDASTAFAEHRDQMNAYNLVLQQMNTNTAQASQRQMDLARTFTENAQYVTPLKDTLDAMAGSWKNASSSQAQAALTSTVAAQSVVEDYVAMGRAAEANAATQKAAQTEASNAWRDGISTAQSALDNFNSDSQTIYREQALAVLNGADAQSTAAQKTADAQTQARQVIDDQLTQLRKALDDAQKKYDDYAAAIQTDLENGNTSMHGHDLVVGQALANVIKNLGAAITQTDNYRNALAKLNQEKLNEQNQIGSGIGPNSLPLSDWLKHRGLPAMPLNPPPGYDPVTGTFPPPVDTSAASAGKKADTAADAQRATDEQMNLFRAQQAVDTIQQKVNADVDKFKQEIADLKTKLDAVKTAEQNLLTPLENQLTAAERELRDFKAGWEALLHPLEVDLAKAQVALDGLKNEAADALAPFQAQVDAATEALQRMQLAAQQADDVFAHQLHDLSNQMYDLEQAEEAAMRPMEERSYEQGVALQALQDELQKIADKYDKQIIPLQRELTDLQAQDAAQQHAQTLHDEAIKADNLAAKLATLTPGTREYMEVQRQLNDQQNKTNREAREFSLEEQIAHLEKMKAAESDLVNAKIKAATDEKHLLDEQIAARQHEYDMRKQQIQDEENLLTHQREEAAWQAKQEQEAQEQKIRDAEATLKAQKDYWDGLVKMQQLAVTSQQEYLTGLQNLYNEQLYPRQKDIDDLSNRISDIKTDYGGLISDIQAKIDTLNTEMAAENSADNPIIKYYNNIKTELSQAYSVIEKIDSAHDKGGKLTQEQATALAAANKTISDLTPKIPPLGTSYEDLAKKVPPANQTINSSVKSTFDPMTPGSVPDVIKRGMDPTVTGSVGDMMKKLFDPEVDKSIPSTLYDQWDALDLTLQKKLDWTKYEVWGNAFQGWINELKAKLGTMKTDAGVEAYNVGKTTAEQLTNGLRDGLAGMVGTITITASVNGGTTGGTATGTELPIRLPGHAAGGIFTTPHVALIAEKGPEAVVPLDAYAPASSLGIGQNITVNLNFPWKRLPTDLSEWREVSRTMSIALQEELRRNGKA